MELKEYVFRMAISLLLGATIGFERHWHHKMAGLRTNILVSMGATLFILIGIQITGDNSPSRIASQIVTGIGFLGAGVIMKEGLSIRGLNTAATLWCSAAVGATCGIGAWQIAFIGTGFIVFTHLLLRPLENYLIKLTFLNSDKSEKQEYVLKVITPLENEQYARNALLTSLSNPSIKIHSITCTNDEDNDQMEIVVHVFSIGKLDDKIQKITNLLNSDSGISSVSWHSQNRSSEF